MANAPKTLFTCSACDAQSSKWSGRCLDCGKWGTLSETYVESLSEKETPAFRIQQANPSPTISFPSIENASTPRFSTGIGELDQVLGGGIVPGSLVLIGGEPGIGKSTLLLQIALKVAQNTSVIDTDPIDDISVLYTSGEESAQQVKLRFDRIATAQKTPKTPALDTLHFLGETNIEKICATIVARKPKLAFVDSIQTVYSSTVPSEAGSLTQVRACTIFLMETAKRHGIPIILVGHVTKEGMVAGPKTLEHMVDTVLYLEGDNQYHYRLLKTVKNRFGSTNEVGVFEMQEEGLREVDNPSNIFLATNEDVLPGTVTSVVMEGTRAFLVQVQALTTKTFFGYPQRRAVGFDTNRLQLLIAVLAKRVGLNLGDQDIHVNVVGGLKITEPAIDLAICGSIISAYLNKPFNARTVVCGEVGLNGEVRPVSQIEKRLKEAAKLGFTDAYAASTLKDPSLRLHTITHLQDFSKDW